MSDRTDTTGSTSRRAERGRRPLGRRLTLLAVVAIVGAGSITSASVPVPPGTDLAGLTASDARHLLAYAGLTGVLATVLAGPALALDGRRRYRTFLLVFVLAVGFGAAIELIQVPLAHRTGSLRDVAVNAIGAATGLLALAIRAGLRRPRT